MKTIAITLLLLLISNIRQAQATAPINALEITHTDGERTYVKLAPELTLSFNAGDASVAFGSQLTLLFDKIGSCRHTYHRFPASGIDGTTPDKDIYVDGGCIYVVTDKAEAYDMSGRRIAVYDNSRGNICIDMNELKPFGTVVLRYGENRTIKIKL
ncbi:hypothetical protein [uncultured Muribaculum sp.]|uniref:hypothetical protein n=1 Tax=uncultured Muribaculum sp. TaxID=1918613 RepID=UPI0025FD1B74|nr:hypothetical protein [uncultured Muribaculum sp.]